MYCGLFVILTIGGWEAANAASAKKNDEVPTECKNKNFCAIKPTDYPEDKFNAMFKGTKTLPQPTLFIEGYGDRQGDPDSSDDCDTEVTYEPLYKVRSAQGQWYTVIQAPRENYIQKVRLETCIEEKSACFAPLSSLVSTITTFCEQTYSVWEFLVSDGNNGTEKIKAELPVCCSCRYKM